MNPLSAALPVLLLLPAAQTEPRPAWEIAPRWQCDMTRLRVCHGLGGRCRVGANRVGFTIDFARSRFGRTEVEDPFHPRTADWRPGDDLAETIAVRAFHALGPNADGFTKIAMTNGDSATLAADPNRDGSHNGFVTRVQPGDQYYFYGTCRPEAVAGLGP